MKIREKSIGECPQLALLVKKKLRQQSNRSTLIVATHLKSEGPKTPEGKAIVSMNSLRDGVGASTVVLLGEDSDLESNGSPNREPSSSTWNRWPPPSGRPPVMEVGKPLFARDSPTSKSSSRTLIGLSKLSAARSAPTPERSVSWSVSKIPGALRLISCRRKLHPPSQAPACARVLKRTARGPIHPRQPRRMRSI